MQFSLQYLLSINATFSYKQQQQKKNPLNKPQDKEYIFHKNIIKKYYNINNFLLLNFYPIFHPGKICYNLFYITQQRILQTFPIMYLTPPYFTYEFFKLFYSMQSSCWHKTVYSLQCPLDICFIFFCCQGFFHIL